MSNIKTAAVEVTACRLTCPYCRAVQREPWGNGDLDESLSPDTRECQSTSCVRVYRLPKAAMDAIKNVQNQLRRGGT